MVGAYVVLPLRQVHSRLAAIGRVHLGDQRRGRLNVTDAALVDSRAEPGQVAHHPATDGGDQLAALDPGVGHRAQDLLGAGQRLLRLARRDRLGPVGGHAVERGDVRVRDGEAPAVQRVEEPRLQQPRTDEHRVLAGGCTSPHQPGARGRLAQRDQRGCGAGGKRLVGAGERGVGGRLVDREAGRVEGVEPRAVAGERPRPAGRPAPGDVGVDLEVHHHVPPQRVAHPLRAQRAAPERRALHIRAGE